MRVNKSTTAGLTAAVLLSVLPPVATAARNVAAERNASQVLAESEETLKDTLRLSLTDVFSRIETENRTIEMLRSASEAAKEGVTAAKNARFPDVNAELNASYIGDAFLTDRNFSNITRAETPHFGNGFTFEAQQVVYAGGAVNASVSLAERQSEMADTQIDKTREGLRLMAAGQCMDLFRIGNNIEVYKENISLTEKLIEEIQARREQGLALANDVTRYELRLEMLKLELLRLENTKATLNFRLCNALGLPEGTVIVPSLETGEGIRPESHEDWQTAARQSSPDLRMADINADMAVTRRQLAKSEILPKIAVVAHENFNGPITFEIPPINKNLNVWYVGLGIRYNFSALYKSNHKIRQADAAARQMSQATEVAQENLRNEVQQAYTDYRQAYQELETRKKSLQLAEENYARVHDRYIEQLVLVTDMLDAFNMKLDAQLGVSDSEAEIIYRLCRLKHAAGIL